MDLLRTAGAVLVGGYGDLEPEPSVRCAVERGEFAGVTIFRRNVESPEQLRGTLHSWVKGCTDDSPPLFAIDQEGGRVARLHAPLLELPPMRRLGALGDAALTARVGEVLGRQLAAVGVNMDFAPVLDVDTNPDNPVIGDRSFGRDAETVAEQAIAFAEGLLRGGCLACGKHFPGHGDTDLDSHLALPSLPHDMARLQQVELLPFARAAQVVPSVMTAHVVFSALDPERPATLSRRVLTELLRGELGYEGVIISDDLEMKAVSRRWPVPEAAALAIEAGADLLLICSDVDALFETRDALAREATSSSAFAKRLQDAARRSLALRRSRPPRPLDDARALGALLDDPEAQQLERRLAEVNP